MTEMKLRVLVTGSRDWPDEQQVRDALRGVASGIASQNVLVVHGHCPTGADAHADMAARIFGMQVERHPADWTKYGRRAGPLRNAEMVRLGADICLAFIRDNSRGASMTAHLAESAGIPVRYFTIDTPTLSARRVDD